MCVCAVFILHKLVNNLITIIIIRKYISLTCKCKLSLETVAVGVKGSRQFDGSEESTRSSVFKCPE